MSLTIHLIVRYRILSEQTPQADQKTLVLHTIQEMAKPCFYTAITTIVAFCSLIVSDIRPVIDFGWMMTIGICPGVRAEFHLFPGGAGVAQAGEGQYARERMHTIISVYHGGGRVHTQARQADRVGLVCWWPRWVESGIGELEVENRFIDHFKSTTEIYRGMELVDTKLGGTIPLDFVIDADETDAVPSLKRPVTDPKTPSMIRSPGKRGRP